MGKIKVWWRKHNLANPFRILWRIIWYAPLLLSVLIYAVLFSVFTLSIRNGIHVYNNRF